MNNYKLGYFGGIKFGAGFEIGYIFLEFIVIVSTVPSFLMLQGIGLYSANIYKTTNIFWLYKIVVYHWYQADASSVAWWGEMTQTLLGPVTT